MYSTLDDEIDKVVEAYCDNISDTNKEWPSDIQKAVTFIQTNICEEQLFVRWLKEKCDINDRNFSAKFKLHLGYYPKAYILHHRIEVSKKILKRTEATVTQAALAVGFKSLSAFCKAFKREIGQRPTKWRNNTIAAE